MDKTTIDCIGLPACGVSMALTGTATANIGGNGYLVFPYDVYLYGVEGILTTATVFSTTAPTVYVQHAGKDGSSLPSLTTDATITWATAQVAGTVSRKRLTPPTLIKAGWRIYLKCTAGTGTGNGAVAGAAQSFIKIGLAGRATDATATDETTNE